VPAFLSGSAGIFAGTDPIAAKRRTFPVRTHWFALRVLLNRVRPRYRGRGFLEADAYALLGAQASRLHSFTLLAKRAALDGSAEHEPSPRLAPP
jgi:hypothetical protein